MAASTRALAGLALAAAIALIGVREAHAIKYTDLTKELREGKEFLGVNLRKPMPPIADVRSRLVGDTVRASASGLEIRVLQSHGGGLGAGLLHATIFYSNDDAVAVLARFTGPLYDANWLESSKFVGVTPVGFEGWSSTLGCVYATDAPGLYVKVHAQEKYRQFFYGPTVTLLRVLKPAGWDVAAGEWTPYAVIAPKVREAVARNDLAAAHALLAGRERPLLGEIPELFQRFATVDSLSDFAQLEKDARAANDWSQRVAVLHALKVKHDQIRVRGKDEEATGRATDMEHVRKELTRLFEIVMPPPSQGLGAFELLRTHALTRVLGGKFDDAATQQFADTFLPHIDNQQEIEKARMPLSRGDSPVPFTSLSEATPFSNLPISSFGGKWTNAKRDDGRQFVVSMNVETPNLSELVSQAANKESKSGGWVPASASQIAEQQKLDALRGTVADAPSQIASIDQRLRWLSSAPLGTEVKGAAAEKQVTSWVDPNGKYHSVVTSESPQNTYRVGVGKDAKERQVLREQLLAERRRLERLVSGGTLPTGSVVNGMVWSDQGGDVVLTPGTQYRGRVRRGVSLSGGPIQARIEQDVPMYLFFPASEPQPDAATLLAKVDKGLDERYHESLLVQYDLALLKAIGQIIEIEAERILSETPEAIAADRQWALAYFELGPAPSPELIKFVRGW